MSTEPNTAKPKLWYKIFGSLADAEAKVDINRAVSINLKSAEVVVALARTHEGFFAVLDNCPHMAVKLSNGVCNRFSEIVCPWHTYRFSLKTGEEVTGHGCDAISIFDVKIDDTGLYIRA